MSPRFSPFFGPTVPYNGLACSLPLHAFTHVSSHAWYVINNHNQYTHRVGIFVFSHNSLIAKSIRRSKTWELSWQPLAFPRDEPDYEQVASGLDPEPAMLRLLSQPDAPYWASTSSRLVLFDSNNKRLVRERVFSRIATVFAALTHQLNSSRTPYNKTPKPDGRIANKHRQEVVPRRRCRSHTRSSFAFLPATYVEFGPHTNFGVPNFDWDRSSAIVNNSC